MLLPELVMTEAEADKIAAELGTPGNIIAHGTPEHTLKVVVSGSYHHVEVDDAVENFDVTPPKCFSREPPTRCCSGSTPNPASSSILRLKPSSRRGSGLGGFLTGRRCSRCLNTSSVNLNTSSVKELSKTALPSYRFPRNLKPAAEIRLFTGPRFSVVVVICADLLDKTFRRVLETLQPSLVLVCNMTPKQGDFASAAHALILACQSTLVSVNNPATWSKSGGILGSAVPGGLAGLPIRDGNKRVIEAHAPSKKILIFDSKARQLQVYPR